ncbi:CPCC family cysteine-rich protein [Pseudomonas sp. HS6]|uniref:CPCC family cysteine-rich protein n=1 Tax=Pseudomonas sp. HS6 TaxID=2850559 RepID=UPI002019B718|nr:CPCC family cysteine-rich protein [Pseudomonas sp. HS6]UQS14287.1 hypothetical protein JJN09_24200 [Pseudomonas sp. HS6]
MKKINRQQAINKISNETLISLDHGERESLLLDWWGIDDTSPEFFTLSEQLQHSIKTNDDLPNDINDSKYNELIQVALTSKFKGVTNIYLSKKLASLKLGDYEVYGDIEPLEVCPCCGYHTLPSLADYDICDLCHWEDNGTTSLDSYSSPNHMTLREAKESFAKKSENLPLDKWLRGEAS